MTDSIRPSTNLYSYEFFFVHLQKIKSKSELVFYFLHSSWVDYSPPMLRFLSICQVWSSCELLFDSIGILKGIGYPNYKLSLIKVILSVSYFVSGAEIWFHSFFLIY